MRTPNWIFVGGLLAVGLLVAMGRMTVRARTVDAWLDLDSPPDLTAEVREPSAEPFRVAVASMLAPVRSYRAHHALGHTVADAFNRPLELVSPRSYAALNGRMRRGEVDLAFVCSGGYAAARDAMDVVAAPVIGGLRAYRAVVVVAAGSPFRSLADLAGRRAACSDPLSNSGCWNLSRQVVRLGWHPDKFFAQVHHTGGHDRSVRAVADGRADVASVGQIFYDIATRHEPSLGARTRIIDRSAPMPNPPVVVPKSTSEAARRLIVAALVGLADTPDGRSMLADMRIERFVPATNGEYRGVRCPRAVR